ncbi:PDZ domain-containing protein [Thalassotalea euphylliae]|uniref:PDZ domain-containing protein n=1 Tax=Thalassotalea euphylliae TaxID=1655234 RepID=UPI00363E9C9B
MRSIVILWFTIIAFSVFADSQGEKGFKMDVSVSGFFSPEVTKATIKSVVKDSSAEKQGIEIGHEVVAIDGCKIPGCSASIAKEALQKNVGEVVILSMLKPNGEAYQAEVILQ